MVIILFVCMVIFGVMACCKVSSDCARDEERREAGRRAEDGNEA